MKQRKCWWIVFFKKHTRMGRGRWHVYDTVDDERRAQHYKMCLQRDHLDATVTKVVRA